LLKSKTDSTSWLHREQNLERKTQVHWEQVQSIFPGITKQDDNNSSSHWIALSSTCVHLSSDDLYLRWTSAELDLRVGLGHDLLQEIRNSTGLQHYYIRKQKKMSRGQKEMQHVARSQKTNSEQKLRFVRKYRSNWMSIQKLMEILGLRSEEAVLRTKGLRALPKNEDITFFQTQDITSGNHAPDSQPSNSASWIWEVAMLDEVGICSTKSNLELVKEWESEGKYSQCQLIPHFIYHHFSARRLSWLRTFTRLERWKEELLLVREEMRRLRMWYAFQIQRFRQQAQQSQQAKQDRFNKGYQSLLNSNIREFTMAYDQLPDAIQKG